MKPCLGNGTVDSTFGADVDAGFSQANDRVQVSSLDQLRLISDSTWTVVRAQLELLTSDGNDIANAAMVAYGNLTLTDTGQVAQGGARNGTVIASNGMNVRRAPGSAGVVVWQLQGGQEITVTGISADREWIRMVIPNRFSGTGWVYAPYIDVEGGSETLTVVTENSPLPDFDAPEFGPGQSFELLSALSSEEGDCDETIPASGLLMQSPSGTPDNLRFMVNSAEIQFNGTIFIQAEADEVLRVSVLEGQSTVIFDGSQATASVNNRVNVPLDANLVVNGAPEAEPFNPGELPGIPTSILPRQIAFGSAPVDETAIEEPVDDEVVVDETEDEEADDTSDTTRPAGFVTPQPLTSNTTTTTGNCTLSAPNEVRNVRAGASTAFDIIQVLQPGDSVAGVGQAVGELNLTWYQTDTGGWIRIDTIEASSGCSTLPVVEAPLAPEATATPSQGLQSSTLSEITCGGSNVTGSATSDGTDTSIAIGGTWTASAGTSATFTTQGGDLRPEFGAYIRLIDSSGAVVASSGEERTLSLTFTADTVFEARFSAANGNTVIVAAGCN